MGLLSVLKRWWQVLFPVKTIEAAIKISPIISQNEIDDIQTWRKVYAGGAAWNNDDTPSLGLAKTICSATAKKAAVGLESKVSDNEWLNDQYKPVIGAMKKTVESICAGGEIIFRPFVRGDKVLVNIAESGTYYHIRKNDQGALEEVVFVERTKDGDVYYTLLTHADWRDGTYSITNTAWKSGQEGQIGLQIDLAGVAAWADLEPSSVWNNTSRPWFVLLAAPENSAIFSGAVSRIRQADKQDARIEWENEGSELAIDAPVERFQVSGAVDALNPRNTTREVELPKGKERLFRIHQGDDDKMQAWTPEIRMTPLSMRLEQIKRNIEDICGVPRGTISEVQEVARTATEVRHLKDRFKDLVEGLQENSEDALKGLVAVMSEVAIAYGLPGAYNEDALTFHWSEFMSAEEREEIFNSRLDTLVRLAGLGIVKAEEVRAFLKEFSEFFALIPEEVIALAKDELPTQIGDEY